MTPVHTERTSTGMPANVAASVPALSGDDVAKDEKPLGAGNAPATALASPAKR